jgi:hypothetical protein
MKANSLRSRAMPGESVGTCESILLENESRVVQNHSSDFALVAGAPTRLEERTVGPGVDDSTLPLQ